MTGVTLGSAEERTFYVGVCSTCWMTFGEEVKGTKLPHEVECPICRDSVLLLFKPEVEMIPFVSRALTLQGRRMRDVYAALHYALALRGPAYLRGLDWQRQQKTLTPLQIMQQWDTNVVEFWPMVGVLLADELAARVASGPTDGEEVKR